MNYTDILKYYSEEVRFQIWNFPDLHLEKYNFYNQMIEKTVNQNLTRGHFCFGRLNLN